MTIAVLIKINEGLVFASDSATSIPQAQGGQFDVANIYNSANKIFNLRKGLPIAAMTAGLGGVGNKSISTLSKDLRMRFSGDSAAHPNWALDPLSYTLEEVAEAAKTFLYDEHYKPMTTTAEFTDELAKMPPEQQALIRQLFRLEFEIGGFDTASDDPKAYTMSLTLDGCEGPNELNPNNTGATWWGQTEALLRLLNGISGATPAALVTLGVPEDLSVPYSQAIAKEIQVGIVNPAMPIADAIELAEYLVRVTIGFVRFCPGQLTVGGPIEIAAVTRHEGFKWVQRKHHFDAKLNPDR